MAKNLRRIRDYCSIAVFIEMKRLKVQGQGKESSTPLKMTVKAIILGVFIPLSLLGIVPQSANTQSTFQHSECPTDLESLTTLLLKDLPSYANRVIARSKQFDLTVDLNTYVIVAGRPEFEALPLDRGQYDPLFKDTSEQVFFTTLERQYDQDRVIEVQNYHWLFLTQTASGWRLFTLFSSLGSPTKENPPLPPKETSDGVIGQAIRLWLRDCRAGAIRS